MKPTQSDLDSLAAQHGKIFLFPVGNDDEAPTMDHCDHVMVLRRPTRAEWAIYEKKLTAAAVDKKSAAAAKLQPSKDLALFCTVWPDKAGQDAIYDEYPGAETILYLQCTQLGEGGGADLAKKYVRASTTSEGAAT